MNIGLNAARFYAILDTAYVPRTRWRSTCSALIAGGADLVQVRAKRETQADRETLTREVLPLFEAAPAGPDLASGPSTPGPAARAQGLPCSGRGSRGPALQPERRQRPLLVINDDVELCARTPGAGLHIGQDDMPPAEARLRIGPDRVLGFSTHSWEQAQAALALPAGVLSYFCVGPVYSTQTKPDYAPVGLELVRRVAAARPALPWFVIGGITRATIAAVVAAGATRVVVVSDVLQSADPAAAIRETTRHLPPARK